MLCVSCTSNASSQWRAIASGYKPSRWVAFATFLPPFDAHGTITNQSTQTRCSVGPITDRAMQRQLRKRFLFFPRDKISQKWIFFFYKPVIITPAQEHIDTTQSSTPQHFNTIMYSATCCVVMPTTSFDCCFRV